MRLYVRYLTHEHSTKQNVVLTTYFLKSLNTLFTSLVWWHIYKFARQGVKVHYCFTYIFPVKLKLLPLITNFVNFLLVVVLLLLLLFLLRVFIQTLFPKILIYYVQTDSSPDTFSMKTSPKTNSLKYSKRKFSLEKN